MIESDKLSIGNKYDHNEDFIRAVVKVQQGHEVSLSNDDEAKAIAPWKLDPESGQDTLGKPVSEFMLIKQARENENKRKSEVFSPKSSRYELVFERAGNPPPRFLIASWSQ